MAAGRSFDVYLATSRLGSITSRALQYNDVLKPYAKIYWPVHLKDVENDQHAKLRRKSSQFSYGMRRLPTHTYSGRQRLIQSTVTHMIRINHWELIMKVIWSIDYSWHRLIL